MWEYQRDLNRLYRERWNEDHRKQQTAYRREYRRQHPEATKEQWRKDTARYRMRHDPDLLRERQRIYDLRYHAKLKALKALEGEADL